MFIRRRDLGRGLESEPALPDPTWTQKREQAAALQEALGFLKLCLTTDELRQLFRKVVRNRIERLQRWEGTLEAVDVDLIDVLGTGEVTQLVLTHVPNVGTIGHVVAHELPGRL